MNELKSLFKEDFDPYDKWGSAMVAYFTVANEISYRGDQTPSSWGYRPAMASDPRESEDHLFEACENAKLDDLIHFGNILERYTRNLDRHGESY